MDERIWVISSWDGGLTWAIDWTSLVFTEEDPGYYVWSPRELAVLLASATRIDGNLAFVTEDPGLIAALVDQRDLALAREVKVQAEAQAVAHGHIYTEGHPA